MITTPAAISYTRTDAGYLVRNGGGVLVGHVARAGRRWDAMTADGTRLGDTYGTRVEAADALVVTARRVAELDALPTDDCTDADLDTVEPTDDDVTRCTCGAPATVLHWNGPLGTTITHGTCDAHADMITRPGDAEPSCRSCGYFMGHTSWCPRRHAEQPAAQLTLVEQPAAHVDGPCADPDCEVLPAIDRATPPADLDDAALWVQFMLEDRALAGYDDNPDQPNDERHGALLVEIARRFGEDASENTADVAVSTHMSADDLVRWAVQDPAHLLGIATGRIVPDWRREDGFGVEYLHANCPACERFVESAVGIARVTGSVGATYGTGGPTGGEHAATVTRGR
jgi:hypothetical protein